MTDLVQMMGKEFGIKGLTQANDAEVPRKSSEHEELNSATFLLKMMPDYLSAFAKLYRQ